MGACIRVTLVGGLLAGAIASVGSPSSAQSPQFRAGVTLVPVEVRVVDKNGDPVRDLTPADFLVREGGRPQQISLFNTAAFDAPAPTRGRTFFIILGRGRLNAPTNAMQALVDFVGSNLMPADRVGVMAYLRVIPPTTDHRLVVGLLEAYRDQHETIDGLVRRDSRHGPLQFPTLGPDTVARIDGLFPPSGGPDIAIAGTGGNAALRYSDFSYVKRALEYLRTVDGEKHVIIVTERAFVTPRPDNVLENYWFQQATSARAALSFIHAGGVSAPAVYRGRMYFGGMAQLEIIGTRQAQQVTAKQTGGTSTFYQYASKPLAALDRATRFQYVLGYYPAREVAPDELRQIEVTVQRPGVTLLYRQGYQATPAIERAEDYREAQIAARIDDAAWQLLDPASVDGITWQLRLDVVAPPKAAGPLAVAVAFDPMLTLFTKVDERYTAEFELLLLADDEQRREVGRLTRRISVVLTPEEFAQTKRKWPTFDVTLDVTTRPAFVRGILYQFDTDRTASRQVRIAR